MPATARFSFMSPHRTCAQKSGRETVSPGVIQQWKISTLTLLPKRPAIRLRRHRHNTPHHAINPCTQNNAPMHDSAGIPPHIDRGSNGPVPSTETNARATRPLSYPQYPYAPGNHFRQKFRTQPPCLHRHSGCAQILVIGNRPAHFFAERFAKRHTP